MKSMNIKPENERKYYTLIIIASEYNCHVRVDHWKASE